MATTPPTARAAVRHDRQLYALLTLVVVALVAETFLRINGLLGPFVGETIFGLAVTTGVLGTLAMAWTRPAERTDTRVAAADVSADEADEADEPRLEEVREDEDVLLAA